MNCSARPLRVGLFGIGLDAYWPQFAGLKERFEGYLGRVKQALPLDPSRADALHQRLHLGAAGEVDVSRDRMAEA